MSNDLIQERAMSMVGLHIKLKGAAHIASPIRYRLKSGFNGGRDPEACHSAVWSPPDGQQNCSWSMIGAWTCDCSGFTAWCLGISRFEKEFPHYGGWINTNSMLLAAKNKSGWFEFCDPEPGCLLVYGKSKRIKIGHVAVVKEVQSDFNGKDFSKIDIVHCSASNDRNFGAAIRLTNAKVFNNKNSRFIRYVG